MNQVWWTPICINSSLHAQGVRGPSYRFLQETIPKLISSVEVKLERRKNHDDREIAVFQDFKVLTSEIISRTAFGCRNLYEIRIPGIRKYFKTR
ncbi:hypothetical protein POPTR_010G139550v4 [Populus trichocarpa]|uniref:Uncharacterized protein n=1 Tax=Populus trichocarpa TaxID=3694 RepID=A0ACC0SDD8_POPTR|nr:hypothetical protein BDE02_10G125100 [Populus trichocarpa]KAI9387229.1 hypothetical protein POPTR_010G139550v4 [Populus trichocarpa]